MPALYPPAITSLVAGLLGLIFVALSIQVVVHRLKGRVMLGEGEGAGPLTVAIRSQANFAEYVPLCLILIAALELRSGPTLLVKGLAAALVLGRIAHPFGMTMKAPNPFRAGGFLLTLLVMAVAGVAAVLAAFSG